MRRQYEYRDFVLFSRLVPWTVLVLLTTTMTTCDEKNDDILTTKGELGVLFEYGTTGTEGSAKDAARKREEESAVEFGLKALEELVTVKEPQWYQMGLYLESNEPANRVAQFGAPIKKANQLAHFGYAAIEAAKKIAQSYPENVSRQSNGIFDVKLLQDECPLRGLPRCPGASRRYRTADGTCNNFNKPWRGSSLLPMQRFLPPAYHDGIQEPRRSVLGHPLPSAREISTHIHREKNLEQSSINLLFMQWGQLIDHDLISTVKSRSFNGSVPRCCHRGGQSVLPPNLLHPSCLPIEVSRNDWFLAPLGIGCIEFIRSAPSTRIDCDLGYREQLNQATSFLDASAIYGSDVETSDAMRTFRKGKIQYGRPGGGNLVPPDPPGGELCREGVITADCLVSGDGRISEQPGLTALHTVWVRYHNRLAEVLSTTNAHWSDEKVYQETRRIVVALFQHITYREFLPIVLGKEVMSLFGLQLEKKGYYSGFDKRVNPAIANAFGAAAFRFGHSLVQNSFIRFDTLHRPIFNNVTLHEEQDNVENIWSFGSLDRLLLGFTNQASQKRDEFICDELSNHLFQSRGFHSGMDLTSINIQRGRDHGLPGYTAWREPCGLSPIKSWTDLERIMSFETAQRFRDLYHDFDDIDLFSGGLAERPVRGGVVGPTFACIIAQQFLNLRKGDRFWYENGGFESSFTPAQLQQLKRVTFAQILCQTLTEISTIQTFTFLLPNELNGRVPCDSTKNFDLSPWIEEFNEIQRTARKTKKATKKQKRRGTTSTTTHKPIKIHTKQTYNVHYNVPNEIPPRPTFDSYDRRTTNLPNDVTYLFGVVPDPTTVRPPPFEVNIKIQYYPRQDLYSNDYHVRPQYYPTTKRPYYYTNDYIYTNKRPQYDPDRDDSYFGTTFTEDVPRPIDTYNLKEVPTKFVKISSVKGEEFVYPGTVSFQVAQREGDLELDDVDDVRFVDLDVVPNETKWMVFNVTTELGELMEVPEINDTSICSSELPRPLVRVVPDTLTKT